MELSDAPGQLRSAAAEAAQAWAGDSSLSLSYTMPWGEECTAATLVDMYLAELAAHAWDLALATATWPGPGSRSGRRSPQHPVLMTGNVSPRSWDATHAQRSVGKDPA